MGKSSYTLAITLLSSLALSNSSPAGVVTSLGAPTSNHGIGDLPSWQGNGDQEDATFTAYIDFSRSAGASARQLIWESGGRNTGTSLVYGDDSTLYLRVRQGSSAITDLSWELSANQLNAGELFVAWVVDLGNNEVRLMMDGLDLNNSITTVATAPFAGSDWSGSGDAGFGTGNGTGYAGGYSGLSAFVGDPFTSGAINTTEGLDFHRNQAFLVSPVPEPLGALAGVAAIGFTCFRRRRELV